MEITELELDTVKNYLKVDYDDDDQLIETMIVAAQSHIETYLNRKFSSFDEIPKELTICCLGLIGMYYDNRSVLPEGKAKEHIHMLFGAILDPHRYWMTGAVDDET